jgi:hypothetical protein
MLIDNRYEKINDNEWLDQETQKIFSSEQYYKSKFGKDFHFLCSPSEFGKKTKLNLDLLKKLSQDIGIGINNITKNDEVMYTAKKKPSLKGKTVLLLGGGPTTNLVNWKNLDYDYVFACNQFFLNEEIISSKPNFISIAQNQDFKNPKLLKYLDNNECILGLELDYTEGRNKKRLEDLADFYKIYRDKICLYQTRYVSVLGLGSRQIILSILMGASKVYFCGHDQYIEISDNGMTAHSAEKEKKIPKWRSIFGKDLQERQIIIMCDYIMKLKKQYQFEICNLAEKEHLCGMSFATREIFPLVGELERSVIKQ